MAPEVMVEQERRAFRERVSDLSVDQDLSRISFTVDRKTVAEYLVLLGRRFDPDGHECYEGMAEAIETSGLVPFEGSLSLPLSNMRVTFRRSKDGFPSDDQPSEERLTVHHAPLRHHFKPEIRANDFQAVKKRIDGLLDSEFETA